MRNLCYVILSFFFLHAFAQNLVKLEQMQGQGAKVSAYVVNLNSGKVMSEMEPGLRLSPASVSKLVIGADALEIWGPAKTFSSQIFMRGTLINHVLNGDLIFYGGGDPFLTNEKLWFLTSDVARYGVNKVTGKIIVNKSLFGNILEDANRNSGRVHSRNAYDAPLSSAAVNFSVLALVVSPAQYAGEKAIVALEPYALPNVRIINNVNTVSSGTSKVFVERDSKNSVDTYTVSGNIALHSPLLRVYRSVSNADVYAGQVINAFLNHNFIQTSGNFAIENSPLKQTDKLVSSVESYPLAWQLRGLFEVSNNFIADMLTLNLGVANHSFEHGESDVLRTSANNLENYMQNVTPNSAGLIPIKLNSGSGLTPENRLSAKDVVQLLTRIYFKTNIFPEFLTALAVPGEEGSLKKRFSSHDHELMLRAKTGTLTEPIEVVALAGYSRLKNGDWVAFAIIVNGSSKNSEFSIENMRKAVDADLERILIREQN